MDLASKKNTDPIVKPKSPRANPSPLCLKLGDNVPRNPHFDPKKMDPLIKHQSSKSHEPPTTTTKTNKEGDLKHNNYSNDGDSLAMRNNAPKILHYDPKKIVPLATSESHSPTARNHHNKTKSADNKRAPRHNAEYVYVDNLVSPSATPFKPHTGGDVRWNAINSVASKGPQIGLDNFRLLKRLGYGDIGSVYLADLRGTNTVFAMKVMDKASLASRNKLLRAQTEREIMSLLDHPFLPTLYSYFETEKFYCLVMEFCSGGNLHSLRQKQPYRRFTEEAARFYASEVLLALEYLHMMGIVYRDLKPENILVRDEGHIMLSDFDLSLRTTFNPTLKTSAVCSGGGAILQEEFAINGCMHPSAFLPRLIPSKKTRKAKSDSGLGGLYMPELMAEPTEVRSMSFVGTHEYLAPEIIRGEGHGSAVDWWTFGIFLYELLHGTTPFKGQGNRATLHNVVGQPLKFPSDCPHVSSAARDLIRGLLVKDPHRRIAYTRGATEIKQHPFFEGVNWALVRSASPPHIPDPIDMGPYTAAKEKAKNHGVGDHCNSTKPEPLVACVTGPTDDTAYIDFEYF